ncbi:MAG: TetR/AcrR family transcriptional regulator [Atopobiaceae bacterium]|nr:TetR/AcrR family transcriptional regulator [Atopobiaceae bacterium]
MGDFEPGDPVDARVTDAVFELMRTDDIPRIRVADVLRQAKVSRSTFYRHFDNVDDVVKTFEDDLLDNMRAINDVALKARFSESELEPTASMVARMDVLMSRREQVIALNGPHGDPTFRHKATAFMRDYFSDRLGEVLGPGDERDLYLAFMLAGHHSLIQFWLAERPDIEPRVVAAALNRLYYAPFFLGEAAAPAGHRSPCVGKAREGRARARAPRATHPASRTCTASIRKDHVEPFTRKESL